MSAMFPSAVPVAVSLVVSLAVYMMRCAQQLVVYEAAYVGVSAGGTAVLIVETYIESLSLCLTRVVPDQRPHR